MLNRLFPTLTLSLLFITGYTQNQVTDSTATCVAYWKKGDVKNLTILKTSTTNQDGKPITTKASCQAIMTVLEESETGYKIKWQYKTDNSSQELSAFEKFNILLTNLTLIYTVKETGDFDSLVNYQEVKKFLTTSIDELLKQPKYKDPEFKKYFAQLRPIIENRIAIEGVLMKDIKVLHSPYGVEFNLNNPQVFETELPNIFGGAPFPAITTLSLLKLEASKDWARIGISQTVDKEKSAVILKEILIKIASPVRSDAKEGIEKSGIDSIELSDNYEYDLSLSDGWMNKISFTRVVKVKDIQKTETTAIQFK